MSRDIRLSAKHGVNPSLMQCFYCGKDYGVALLGETKGDQEAPRRAVYEMKPCPECEKLMAQGVMLISTREGENGKKNPYRTGKMVVIKDDGIRRIVSPPELAEAIIKRRVAFVPDDAWDKLGLSEAAAEHDKQQERTDGDDTQKTKA